MVYGLHAFLVCLGLSIILKERTSELIVAGATNLGATFDTELLYKVGREVAKETLTKSANILLAPTLNVIRSPLGKHLIRCRTRRLTLRRWSQL